MVNYLIRTYGFTKEKAEKVEAAHEFLEDYIGLDEFAKAILKAGRSKCCKTGCEKWAERGDVYCETHRVYAERY